MTLFDVKLVLPDILYHGTTFMALEGFKAKPINSDFWKDNKDFGAGFYTTIDLYQATDWARSNISAILRQYKLQTKKGKLIPLRINEARLPLVLQFIYQPNMYNGDNIGVQDFRGESEEWIKFILSHRYQATKEKCLCSRHPHIACGCMADNDTGKIIEQFKQEKRNIENKEDIKWFWDQIILSKKGKLLNGLDLGDQIAFFDEKLNPMLRLKGYYVFNPNGLQQKVTRENFKEEWIYYDANGNRSQDSR